MWRVRAWFLYAVVASAAKPPDAVKYLPPSAFRKQLPAKVIGELQRRKCLVPQFPRVWTFTDHINVNRGEFTKPGQEDWAVVCATAQVVLLVFANGSETAPAELPVGERNTYWFTGRVPLDQLKANYGDKFDHDGIGVTDANEKTIIHYFQEGHWTSFPSTTGLR